MVKKKANICLKNPIEKTLQFIHSQFTQNAQINRIINMCSRDGAEPHRRSLVKIEYVLPSSKHPSNLVKSPPIGGLFTARIDKVRIKKGNMKLGVANFGKTV